MTSKFQYLQPCAGSFTLLSQSALVENNFARMRAAPTVLLIAIFYTFTSGFAVMGLKDAQKIDLKELRERYDLAYTHPTRRVNASWIYLSINDPTPTSSRPKETCGSLTTMSDKQRNVVAHAFGAPSPEWIQGVLDKPKAKLFQEDFYSGVYEDYFFTKAHWNGGCRNLNPLKRNVSSVSTFEKCVRLFTELACDGWSLAVYPGNSFSRRPQNTKMTQVKSIGPCLLEEFQSSAYKNEANNSVIKNTSDIFNNVFDLVQFGRLGDRGDAVSSINNSVTYRLLGPRNRLEFIHATVRLEHLSVTQASGSMEKSNFYKSLDQLESDVVGYAIPPAIGGPANETYNIFPARQQLKTKWENLTSSFRSYLERDNRLKVLLSLNLLYEDVNQTRPYGLYYHIWDDKISYGRLQN